MNYFRNFASVPPPSVMPPPVYQCLPSVTMRPTSSITAPRPTTVAMTPPFQTSNLRPIVPGDRTAFQAPLQHPTYPAKRQPDSTNFANGTTRVCDKNNNTLSTAVNHSLAPEVARVQRELVEWKAANLSSTGKLDGIGLSNVPDMGTYRRQNQRLPTSDLESADASTVHQDIDVNGSSSTRTRDDQCSNTNDRASGRLSLNSVESSGTSSLSPADSGWTSDTSIGRTSRESEFSNESATGIEVVEALSCPASPLSSKGDEFDNGNGRPESIHRDDECCVDEVSKTRGSSVRLEDDFDRCCKLVSGTGKAASSKLVQVASSVVENGAGDGDDESESSLSLPRFELDAAKSVTASVKETVSQVGPAPTTRTVRPMKCIPVRFQRLLEVEVERVSAMRRRVVGSPLYATGLVASTPSADAMHEVPQGQVVESGSQKFTNQTSWTTVPVFGVPEYNGSTNLYDTQAFQLHYASPQMQYGPGAMVPATSAYYFPAAAPFMAVNDPSSTVTTQTTPVGVVEYQAPSYDGCYMQQPYYYTTYFDGVTPSYVVQVDGGHGCVSTSSMIENQPNFQTSPATPNDHRVKDRAASATPSAFVPAAGITYVVGSGPSNELYAASRSSTQERSSYDGTSGGLVVAAGTAGSGAVYQPCFSTSPYGGSNTTMMMTSSDVEYCRAVYSQQPQLMPAAAGPF